MKVEGAAQLSVFAGAVDALLEASVVGKLSKIGPELRRRTAHWEPPSLAEDKTVVITGATSGLGLAMATALVELGAAFLWGEMKSAPNPPAAACKVPAPVKLRRNYATSVTSNRSPT